MVNKNKRTEACTWRILFMSGATVSDKSNYVFAILHLVITVIIYIKPTIEA
jgi:hypothetical protein